MAAPPLDSPCNGPVTYPEDTKILIKPSNGRSGPTLNMTKKARFDGQRFGKLKVATWYVR